MGDPQIALNRIIAEINYIYNPQNIFFNISIAPFDCQDCWTISNSYPPPYENCITGYIYSSPYLGLIGNHSAIGSGVFSSTALENFTPAHELGHSLGLLHTFQSNVYENIIRNSNDPNCQCNCATAGDNICDTGALKGSVPYSTIGDECSVAYNTPAGIPVDLCGHIYGEVINGNDNFFSKGLNNIMGFCWDYHPITRGQKNMIIIQTNNRWRSTGNSDPTFLTNNTINNETNFSGLVNIDNDLIINSKLNLINCNLNLTNGHKIILNNGGELFLNNSTIDEYAGENCFTNQFPNINGWAGIVLNPNGGYVKLRISNDSKLLNSNTAIKNETSGIIELEINESQVITKQDKSNIELNQTQGNIVLYHSIFNNSIKFTKTQKVQIHGCQFIKTEPGTNAIEVVDSDLSMSGENRIEGFSRSVLFNGPNNHFVLVDNFNFSNENLTSTSDNSIFISNAFTCNIGNSSGVINKKGIEIQNSKITRIRNTSINILGSSPAIRIGSIDFDIFNNVITGTGTQNGIEIKSSSTSANLISSNSFNNLAVGIKNFGDNGTKTMGLDLRCNLFNNSNFDIVSDNDLTPTIGNENSSAGNNFFYNSEQFGDLIYTTPQS